MLVTRLLEDHFTLRVPVLETHLRDALAELTNSGTSGRSDTGTGTGTGKLDALVVCEPAPPQWRPTAPAHWHPLAGGRPGAPAALRRRLTTWLDEWQSGAEPPSLRPRWSRPGWHARATAWISTALSRAGRTVEGPIEVRRLWGISALLYARTGDGGAWFKAVYRPFAHEPAVTQLIERAAPGTVSTVIAIEPDEGWLLLDHAGEIAAEHPDEIALEESIRALVLAQCALIGREAEFVALGCPERPLSSLAADVARVTDGTPPLEGVTLPPRRIAELVSWVEERAAWLAGIAQPDVVIHGDFHTGNLVIGADGSTVIIDWSDAAIAHPLMDVAACWEAVPDAERRAQCWDTWLDALAPLGDVDSVRGERATIEALSAAYQVVSYADIVQSLEPATRYQLSDGVQHFLALLDTYVPA